ncbi:LPS export ABC transporter permease LptG [bacterium]|nr:LPS export ABC transporter permease LptG [bacterium]
MIKIIDRYILSNFIKLIFFIIIAGTSIFLIVDLIENLDKFIDRDVPYLYIIYYYIYYIPYIVYLIFPVCMLLTTLFTLGSMAQRNEITAMKAGGISVYRVLTVLMIPAILISVFMLFTGETVVPYANKLRLDINREYIKKVPKSSTTRRGRIYLMDEDRRLVYIGHFNGETNTAFKINIMELQGNKLVKRVDSERMVYNDGYWTLYNTKIRQFSADSVKFTEDNVMRWKELTFKPDDLLKIQSMPEEMNYWELKDFVDRLIFTGSDATQWRIELYYKIAAPFANFIIVIFGVPIAVTKRRSGLMVGFGISLLVCFLYFGLTNSIKILGFKGLLEPLYSAWGGNIAFFIIGIIMVISVKK